MKARRRWGRRGASEPTKRWLISGEILAVRLLPVLLGGWRGPPSVAFPRGPVHARVWTAQIWPICAAFPCTAIAYAARPLGTGDTSDVREWASTTSAGFREPA